MSLAVRKHQPNSASLPDKSHDFDGNVSKLPFLSLQFPTDNHRSIRISTAAKVWQSPTVEFIEHYRNIFSEPQNFIKRRVDYGKMRVYDDKYRKEAERSKSFTNFPDHLKHLIPALSKSGFYYFGNEKERDKVKCIFCQGVIQNWKKTHIPKIEHKMYFPTCPFLLNLNVIIIGNEPVEENSYSYSNEDPDLKNSIGNIPYVVAKNDVGFSFSTFYYEKMWDVESREKTFSEFPLLAKFSISGLYVVKNLDNLSYLKCYECKKEIEILSEEILDLPENVFHRINCSYVNKTQQKLTPVLQKKTTCFVEYSITNKEIEARMDSRNIQQFSKFVSDDCNIAQIIERRLKERGTDYIALFEFLRDSKNFNKDLSNRSEQLSDNINDFVLVDYCCVVCLDKPVAVVFLPCGHLKSCYKCSMELISCPVCRKTVERRVHGFRFLDSKIV